MVTNTEMLERPARNLTFLLLIGTTTSAIYSRILFDYFLGSLCLLMFCFAFFGIEDVKFSNLFKFAKFKKDWLLWVLAVAMSLIVNGYHDLRAFNQVFEFRWIIGMFLFSRALEVTGISEKVLQTLFLIYAVICCFLLFHFLMYPEIPGTPFLPNRFKGFYFNPNDFAHTFVLIVAFLTPFVFFSKSESRWHRGILLFCLSIFSICIFLTYSRICLFAMICGFLFAFYRMQRAYFHRALFGLSAVFLILFFFNIGGFKDRLLYTVTLNENGQWIDGRWFIWIANWNMFIEHPLFGVGHFRNVDLALEYYARLNIPLSFITSHAHNQLLQWLVGVGCLGLMLILNVFRRFIFLVKTIINDVYRFAFYNLIFVFFIAGLFDSNFEIKNAHSIFIIFLALFLKMTVSK